MDSYIDLEQIDKDKALFERREKMMKVGKTTGTILQGMASFTKKFFHEMLKLVKGGTKSSAPKAKSGLKSFIVWFCKFSAELQKMDKKMNNEKECKPKESKPLKKKEKVVYTSNYNINST